MNRSDIQGIRERLDRIEAAVRQIRTWTMPVALFNEEADRAGDYSVGSPRAGWSLPRERQPSTWDCPDCGGELVEVTRLGEERRQARCVKVDGYCGRFVWNEPADKWVRT